MPRWLEIGILVWLGACVVVLAVGGVLRLRHVAAGSAECAVWQVPVGLGPRAGGVGRPGPVTTTADLALYTRMACYDCGPSTTLRIEEGRECCATGGT